MAQAPLHPLGIPALTLALLLIGPAATGGAAQVEAPPSTTAGGHPVPGLGWSAPFAALLLCIAVLPLVPATRHWWEHNRSKLLVSLALGLTVLAYYGLRGYGHLDREHGTVSGAGLATVVAVTGHALVRDYVPFMALLFSLYVIAGGLQLKGDLLARPAVNTGLLGLGAVLASLFGTTGASMILIRPLLHTNRDRKHVRHTVIFFIFLVSNIGGCLLPLGDPPLFLGYLQGVPFLWTVRLALPWLFCVGAVLSIYYAWERFEYRREGAADLKQDVRHFSRPRLHGAINLAWMLGVVFAVALIVPGKPLLGAGFVVPDHLREVVLLGLVGLSLATTPRHLRRDNQFTYAPIAEVAALFLGIFLTMQVPLEILQARGAELGLRSPAQYFWATGLLSSFLDNAPTYLVFFETAGSLPAASGAEMLALGGGGAIRGDLLTAISLGAVFMGANTYIGNGPNFMVKAIAEERGVKMPGFFGYVAYSAAVLLPVFAAVTFLFLR